MTIEWITPMIGGVIISISLGVLFILNGTTLSVGDMLKNTLERTPSVSWNNQILFLIGLIVSPIIFTALFYPIVGTSLNNDPITIVFSGLSLGAAFNYAKAE